MTAPVILMRDAIRGLLKADVAIAALAGSRVFDRVPSPPRTGDWPFVAFGPMRATRSEVGEGDNPILSTVHRLYTASTEYERDQAWELMDLVENALDGKVLELPEPWGAITEMRLTLAGDIIQAGDPKQVFGDVSCMISRLDPV